MDSLSSSVPLVSICIPAYNAEHFIAATLESALAQDYPHLEIIVSDDCSTDRTPEIVKEYTSAGVLLLNQPKNLGMHANWNAVIRASRGKYVCKLDADDILAPAYVSNLVEVMEAHPKIAFAHCACRLIDVDGNFIDYERSIHGSFIRDGLQEWPRYVFGPKAINIVMLRRSAFDAVGGYDERFAYTGDWKMHRDLLKVGQVFYNDKVLATYRCHSVGKAGVRLLQVREHLLHLEDMMLNWPSVVPGKDLYLAKARKRFAMSVVWMAARADQSESILLLEHLPLYGSFWKPVLVARFIQAGGKNLVCYYLDTMLFLRHKVKKLLYKSNSNIIYDKP